MEQEEVESLLRSFDRRMNRVEQILPTLATKEEVQEVRNEVRNEGKRTRRHFDVVAESLRQDIRFIAEGQAASSAKLDGLRLDMEKAHADHERRLRRLEAPHRRP